MAKFNLPEYYKQGPTIQVIPLIDILFFTLLLFMTLAAYSQSESEISISVPRANESKDVLRNPGEIIVNITKDGQFIVNHKDMGLDELEDMFKKVSALFPNQSVIIRADEDAYHKYVVEVLDICTRAEIWNIAFSTTSDKDKP